MISKKNRLVLSSNKESIRITKRNNLKNKSDFYFLNCLQSFRTENRGESKRRL